MPADGLNPRQATASKPDSGTVVNTLCKACADGDILTLKQLIQDDTVCVNKPDISGSYPLQWAALHNHTDIASLLLSRGAGVNNSDHNGQTALHWASKHGSLPVMSILLNKNADYEIRDHAGLTAAHAAAESGHTSVLYYLVLKWAVNIDTQDNVGRTPLHWAARNGHTDTIRLLVVLDARCSLADSDSCTPLHLAAAAGFWDACTVLLQGGSKPALTIKDQNGSTPFLLAAYGMHKDVAKQLDVALEENIHEKACCGPRGPMRLLIQLKLCIVVWALTVILTYHFLRNVSPRI